MHWRNLAIESGKRRSSRIDGTGRKLAAARKKPARGGQRGRLASTSDGKAIWPGSSEFAGRQAIFGEAHGCGSSRSERAVRPPTASCRVRMPPPAGQGPRSQGEAVIGLLIVM
jgi:hypothetical protein